LNPWQKGVLCLTTALTAAVLVKLWSSGLVRIYKLFTCYLAADFLSSLAALYLPYDTDLYGYAYFSSQTLKIVIASLALVEIYSFALERTPALAAFGRSTVGYLLAAAAVIPLVVAFADRSPSAHPGFRAYLLFEQTMHATIAIFLILISVFMAWFPLQLRRNVIVYVIGFIVWSLSRSTGLHLVIGRSGNKWVSALVNMILMAVTIACLLFWLIGLRKEGEGRTAVVGHLWNRAEAERLTRQLDAINDSLDRMRRR
jgi:hypothetical protein